MMSVVQVFYDNSVDSATDLDIDFESKARLGNKNRAAGNWTRAQEVAVCEAFIHVSKDVKGVNRRREDLYLAVLTATALFTEDQKPLQGRECMCNCTYVCEYFIK